MSEGEVENLCTSCGEGDGSGKTGKCAACLDELVRQGWKVRASGVLVNTRTGAKITPKGNVTVTSVAYNPRMAALLEGEIEPEDLDDEELARGMCRDVNGNFPRKPPVTVPRVMYDRMTQVLFKRAEEALRENLVNAAESMGKIIGDPEVDAGTRLKAAQWLYERLMGKAPTEVRVTQERPFEHILTKVKRGPRVPVADADPVG